MLRTVFLRRTCALFCDTYLKNAHPVLSGSYPQSLQAGPKRALSQPPKNRGPGAPVRSDESPLPEPPTISAEDFDFLKDLAGVDAREFESNLDREGGSGPSRRDDSDLPEPPKAVSEWDDVEALEDEEDDDCIIEGTPYLSDKPNGPTFNFQILSGEQSTGENQPASDLELTNDEGGNVMSAELEKFKEALRNDPSLEQVIAAWARATTPAPIKGPMPLYELANKSVKIKELVKLGVDFSKIVRRHGDLERLLHLDWEQHIKPQIRFLVDCGINPDHLPFYLTQNTALLWTDKDDIQVRINYLEAKQFSSDEINNIINKAAFWLTTKTKEIDARLGFIQRTFHLKGNEVRTIATSFPRIVSSPSPKWEIFVDSTKLLDRVYGFNEFERKEILFQQPDCYMRPGLVMKAFDYCHNEIGLTHTQLVRHANVLVTRLKVLKPRYEFLKFLNRDTFDVTNPLYTSPDWLWKGSIEEFCCQAAKASLTDFENFLRHSTVL